MSSTSIINNSSVNEIDCTSETPLIDSLKLLLEPNGGISNFISKNDLVLLKPNFNTGDPFPASTDPQFLLTVIQLVLTESTNIQIIESSMIRQNTKKIIESKMGDELKELDIPIITERDFKYTRVNLNSLGARFQKFVKFPQQILDPDVKIILLPCLKTHFIAQYTGALKLAVGFMERKQRFRMHLGFQVPEKVAEINLGYKPHLIIMDARKIFITGGPAKGTLESPQKIITSSSRVKIDIRGVEIIKSYSAKNKLRNKDPRDVRTIKRALEVAIDDS